MRGSTCNDHATTTSFPSIFCPPPVTFDFTIMPECSSSRLSRTFQQPVESLLGIYNQAWDLPQFPFLIINKHIQSSSCDHTALSRHHSSTHTKFFEQHLQLPARCLSSQARSSLPPHPPTPPSTHSSVSSTTSNNTAKTATPRLITATSSQS